VSLSLRPRIRAPRATGRRPTPGDGPLFGTIGRDEAPVSRPRSRVLLFGAALAVSLAAALLLRDILRAHSTVPPIRVDAGLPEPENRPLPPLPAAP